MRLTGRREYDGICIYFRLASFVNNHTHYSLSLKCYQCDDDFCFISDLQHYKPALRRQRHGYYWSQHRMFNSSNFMWILSSRACLLGLLLYNM
ncbi:unnamed protein product [Brassica rapa subsp. trilocularis]